MTDKPQRGAPAPVGRKADAATGEGTAAPEKPAQQPVPGVNEMVAEALAGQKLPEIATREPNRVEQLSRVMAKAMGVDPDHHVMGAPQWKTFIPDAQMAIAAHEFLSRGVIVIDGNLVLEGDLQTKDADNG